MEYWIPMKEIPDYEVSNEGRVRNAKTKRILKTNHNQKGYEQICLRKNKEPVTRSVHRVVADSFFAGDHDGYDVNHIDGNKTNNHISNLEFCTRKENVIHAFKTGLKRPSRQVKIRVIETGIVYESIHECGRSIGCNPTIIGQCLSGRQKSCNGYHFEKLSP